MWRPHERRAMPKPGSFEAFRSPWRLIFGLFRPPPPPRALAFGLISAAPRRRVTQHVPAALVLRVSSHWTPPTCINLSAHPSPAQLSPDPGFGCPRLARPGISQRPRNFLG